MPTLNLIVATWVFSNIAAAQTPAEVGRWVVMHRQESVSTENEKTYYPNVLFRLDTKTGKIFACRDFGSSCERPVSSAEIDHAGSVIGRFRFGEDHASTMFPPQPASPTGGVYMAVLFTVYDSISGEVYSCTIHLNSSMTFQDIACNPYKTPLS
jgi:hypothetical protein